ncbi:hypothetical protein [Vibrio sp. RE86]|uniref:hypothetical protein n=1 Tax=Vibrio sp. RE86 TaxID=2607605 RepID=UPI001C12768C|nr:hypothetical protein [Vibrio sp. RE86]
MKKFQSSWISYLACFLLCFPLSASAYIGPGVGLSAIGSLLAIVLIFVLVFIGFIWFPLKRVMKKRKAANQVSQDDSQ